MKTYEKELSIIIPVYNGQDTIEKCLDSILTQIDNNTEVIVVDDGSTDDSVEICSNIAEKDRRLIILKKENGGVSSARNEGIKAASGKFLMFVDCDDVLMDGYISAFQRRAKLEDEHTLVLSRIRTHYASNGQIVLEGEGLETETDISKDKMVDIWENHIWNPPFNKIFLRKIIVENKIIFDTNVAMGEDWLFNNSYARALNLKSFYIIEDVVYDYYLDKNPWRHCKKEEFYRINKKQVADFKNTLLVLDVNQKEISRLEKRDLDFTIAEIRRIARDCSVKRNNRIKQIALLIKAENVHRRIKKHHIAYDYFDIAEFITGSAFFIFMWENSRKVLGNVVNKIKGRH